VLAKRRRAYARGRPVVFTRARPCQKNANARVEQRNWTRARQHFGYERNVHPAVTPLGKPSARGRWSRCPITFCRPSSWKASIGAGGGRCGRMAWRSSSLLRRAHHPWASSQGATTHPAFPQIAGATAVRVRAK